MMKKYIIFLLCVISTINAMEPQTVRHETREWDAQAYDNGNALQTNLFLHLLNSNNIITANKRILDVGCGTSKISALLAATAEHVHCFDASKNMIDYAQNKYGHLPNISFEHCFAEDFQSQELYDLALASCVISWVEDKKQAFQRINDSLKDNGEFFGNIYTNENTKPNLNVFFEMASTINWLHDIVANKTVEELFGSTYPSHQEVCTMLKETNFTILKYEEQTFKHRFADREEVKSVHLPIISSRPVMQLIPEEYIESFLEEFINRLLEKFEKNEDGSFDEPIYTTIIHAQKK